MESSPDKDQTEIIKHPFGWQKYFQVLGSGAILE